MQATALLITLALHTIPALSAPAELVPREGQTTATFRAYTGGAPTVGWQAPGEGSDSDETDGEVVGQCTGSALGEAVGSVEAQSACVPTPNARCIQLFGTTPGNGECFAHVFKNAGCDDPNGGFEVQLEVINTAYNYEFASVRVTCGATSPPSTPPPPGTPPPPMGPNPDPNPVPGPDGDSDYFTDE